MLHRLPLFVIAVLFGLLLGRWFDATPSSSAAKVETAYERIMRTGTIRCGYVLYAAYVQKDANTGQLSGVSYDIANELARRQNLKTEWSEEVGWGSFIEGLKARRYDMVCSGGWQAANEGKLIAYAPPIYYAGLGLWVRSDDTRFDADYKILNAPGYKFVATDGSLTGTLAAEYFPKVQILGLPNLTDFASLYANVTTGKADAVLAETYDVERYLAQNPGSLKNLLASQPLRVFPVSPLILPNDDWPLQNMVNAGVNELLNSGFVENTLQKYCFGPEMGLRVQAPYRLP